MRKIAMFCLLIIVLSMSQSALVAAESFSREFRDIKSEYSPTDKRYAFDVIATIQTESDGSWIIGHSYQVEYKITLSYLNETFYDRDSFSIHCYAERAIPSAWDTDVTAQNSGMLTYNVTAEPMGNRGMNEPFAITLFNNGQIVGAGSWFPDMQHDPILITVVNPPTATPFNISERLSIEPIYIIMICLFIIILTAVGVAAYKIGKKQPK